VVDGGVDLGYTNLGHNGVLGEGGAPHEVL
jgi:hypothetical protein